MDSQRTTDGKCARCAQASSLRVRSDLLCLACFESFAASKFVKRIEGFKARGPGIRPRKILVPLSFGPSSLVLLHLLDQRLFKQMRTVGRPGFEVVVLHVAKSGDEVRHRCLDGFQTLAQKYPGHRYHCSTLDAVLVHKCDTSTGPSLDSDGKGDERLAEPVMPLLEVAHSFKSASLRSELLDIAQTRLILERAKEWRCDAVAWGDSTTRLSERALTAISTGRGLFVPYQTADGLIADGLTSLFPLRDLMRQEILSFFRTILPDMCSLSLEHDPSADNEPVANVTIQDLMHRYFESTEEAYPNIVANVAKTAGRLNSHVGSQADRECLICATPMAGGSISEDNFQEETQPKNLCYGCAKSYGNSMKSLSIARDASPE